MLPRTACALGVVLLLASCQCEDRSQLAGAGESPSDPLGPEEKTEGQESFRSSVSLLDISSRCDLFQQGLVLDLGSDAIEQARSFRLTNPEPLQRVAVQGRSYARLTEMQTHFLVWLPAPIEQLEVSALVRGGPSERLAIYLDDKRLGAARLHQDTTQVVRLGAGSKSVDAGLHEVIVSLSRRRGQEPGADLSWLRIGPAGTENTDRPPSRDEVFSEMSAGGEQRRAVILRHGGTVACPLWVPEDAVLETAVGVWGSGGAVASVKVRTSSGQTTSLQQLRLEPQADEPGWVPLRLDLSSYSGRAVELQLVAERVAEGSRVGFSTPSIAGPERTKQPHPRAKQVIVLLLSGLGKRHETTTAAANGLPFIGGLARTSELLSDYRTPSTSVTAVVTSLISGKQPWQHGLQGEEHLLNPKITGLAEALQASGGRAAFFTGVPLSFAGFGLSRGFEEFSSISPVLDRPTTAPIDEAEAWLNSHRDDERPRLVFIHLRGGHPPFDVDRDAARALPPAEYGGDLDARRAAIQLSEIRGRASSRRRMPEEDWTRFLALQKAALLKQDQRISQFLAWLSQTGLDQDTLLVVMGDVAAGERPTIPFPLTASVTDDLLQTLLLIRHPDAGRAGQRTHLPVSTVDVTATIAGYLGIDLPGLWPHAIDLGQDHLRGKAAMREQIAYRDGEYIARLGPYLLEGESGKRPSLCLLSLDPGCLEERNLTQPIATRALWTSTWLELSSALSSLPEPVKREFDPELEAALTVWGVPR